MAGDVSAGEDGGPISAINVTPFVDVVLVLLVIFMLTAPLLVKDSILIKLPKAKSTDQKSAATFGLAVTRNGQFLLNGKTISPEDLILETQTAAKKDPEMQAIISADTDARHGDVVRAIDIVKSAGLTRFAIQIEHQ